MIKIKNLKKSFGDLQVLKGIDLEIAEREVVGSNNWTFGKWKIYAFTLYKFFGSAD